MKINDLGFDNLNSCCRRWKAYQLTLKIIKVRAKKHCYLDPMPDSRTNEVKNRTKKYKGFSQ